MRKTHCIRGHSLDLNEDGRLVPSTGTVRCAACARMRTARVSVEEKRRRQLLYNYGLTEAEYEELLARQDGVCAICRGTDWCRRRAKQMPHVDHCHETGVVRGLLCFRCNIGIGMLRDSVAVVDGALEYLARGGVR